MTHHKNLLLNISASPSTDYFESMYLLPRAECEQRAGKPMFSVQHFSSPRVTKKKMAGVAGLEPVTSAVTGQRSNQLSYTPAKGKVKIKNIRPHVKVCFVAFSGIFSKPENYSRVLLAILLNKSGQQTPRRWGWGTPLKKRAATRMNLMWRFGNGLSTFLWQRNGSENAIMR